MALGDVRCSSPRASRRSSSARCRCGSAAESIAELTVRGTQRGAYRRFDEGFAREASAVLRGLVDALGRRVEHLAHRDVFALPAPGRRRHRREQVVVQEGVDRLGDGRLAAGLRGFLADPVGQVGHRDRYRGRHHEGGRGQPATQPAPGRLPDEAEALGRVESGGPDRGRRGLETVDERGQLRAEADHRQGVSRPGPWQGALRG